MPFARTLIAAAFCAAARSNLGRADTDVGVTVSADAIPAVEQLT